MNPLGGEHIHVQPWASYPSLGPAIAGVQGESICDPGLSLTTYDHLSILFESNIVFQHNREIQHICFIMIVLRIQFQTLRVKMAAHG